MIFVKWVETTNQLLNCGRCFFVTRESLWDDDIIEVFVGIFSTTACWWFARKEQHATHWNQTAETWSKDGGKACKIPDLMAHGQHFPLIYGIEGNLYSGK